MSKPTNYCLALWMGLFFFLLTQNNVSAQQAGSMINWETLELTGADAKLAPKSFKWWYLSPLAITPVFFLDGDEPEEPTPAPPPQIQCLPDQNLPWDTPLPAPSPGDLLVTVFCDDPEYTVSLEAETSNGGSGCSGAPLIITRTYRVTDACGEIARCSQQFIYAVDDTAPVITCPPNLTLDCGSDLSPEATGSPNAADDRTPDGQLTVTYTDDNSGLTGCSETGTLLRTWTVTDACGNSSSCVQEITIADTQAPTITCPPNTLFACNQPFTPDLTGWAEATDQCAVDAVVIEYQDDASNLQDCTGYVDRTWLAADPCGNMAQCVQRLTVIPTNCDYQPDITVIPANCNQTDGSVALAGIPGDFTIIWSNGATGPVVDNLPVGVVEAVIIEADSSCSQLLTVVVDAGPPFPFDITGTQPPSVPGGSDGSISLFVPGPWGAPPFTLLVNSTPRAEFSGPDYVLENLMAGTYQLQIIDANGCPSAEQTVPLIDPVVPGVNGMRLGFHPNPPILDARPAIHDHPSLIEHPLPESGWQHVFHFSDWVVPAAVFSWHPDWQVHFAIGNSTGSWRQQQSALVAEIPVEQWYFDAGGQFFLTAGRWRPAIGLGLSQHSLRWKNGWIQNGTAQAILPTNGHKQSWLPYFQGNVQIPLSAHLRLNLGIRHFPGMEMDRALGSSLQVDWVW